MKFCFIFCCFIFCTFLFAQDGRMQWERRTGPERFTGRLSTLRGEVLNHNGTPAAGVSVKINGVSGTQGSTTGAQGEFQFNDLPWGTYDLEADSGTLSAHETVTLSSETAQVSLRFGPTARPAQAAERNSISAQQLKVPEKARKQYEKALEEAQKGNKEKSLNKLAEALRSYPCYSDALTLNSVLDLQSGRAKAAADEAQRAIGCDGSNGKAYVVLGAALNVQQEYEEAIRTLNEGIRFQPDAWQPHYELGKSLLALHRTREAVAELKRAEGLAHNSFPPLHAAMATALMQMNDYQDARAQCLLFLKTAPEHPEAAKVRKILSQIEAKLQTAPATGEK